MKRHFLLIIDRVEGNNLYIFIFLMENKLWFKDCIIDSKRIMVVLYSHIYIYN